MTANPALVEFVATTLLQDSHAEPGAEEQSDPVLQAIEDGRRSALRLMAEEVGTNE